MVRCFFVISFLILKSECVMDGCLAFMIFVVFFSNVWVQLFIRNQGYTDLIFNVVVFPCYLDVSLIMVINLLIFRGVFLTHF